MNEQGVHQAPIIVTLREMAESPVSPLLYGHFIELGYGIQTEPMAQGGEATAARSDLSLPQPVSLRKWPDAVGGAALSPRALGSAHRGLTLQEVGAEFTERECLLATDASDSRATFGLFIPLSARVLLDDFSLIPTKAAHVWHPEVVEAARRVKSNIIRWPGGYFASFYDWRYADG